MARTTLDIDENLVEEALRLSGCKTKKQLVHLALRELVTRIKRRKLLELEGKVNWEGNLDDLRQDRPENSD